MIIIPYQLIILNMIFSKINSITKQPIYPDADGYPADFLATLAINQKDS